MKFVLVVLCYVCVVAFASAQRGPPGQAGQTGPFGRGQVCENLQKFRFFCVLLKQGY